MNQESGRDTQTTTKSTNSKIIMSTPYLNTAGKFTARVEKPQDGWIQTIGKNNNPAIVLPLVVIGGPCDNQRIRWTGFLTDSALPNTVKTLHEAFRFDGNWGALVRDPLGFEGFDCNITTEHEEYQGKSTLKVKWLNAPHEALAESEVMDIISSLDGRSKAVIADLKAKKEPAKEESDEMKW